MRRLIVTILLIPFIASCTSLSVGMSYSDHELIDGTVTVIRADQDFTEILGGYCEQINIPTIFKTVAIGHCGVQFKFQ